jgi:hypothetical protein
MNLDPKYKARFAVLRGPYSGDSMYAAICIYSTKNIKGFSPPGQYMAWWREADGSDGIVAVW